MSNPSSPLENLSIATPCPADWATMSGDERVRFCTQCQLNVYNLSGMTREEAETLLIEKEGRVCVRFYQRADGTILTKDCPVGLKTLQKRKIMRMGASVAAAVTILTVCGIFTTVVHAQTEMGKPMTGAPSPVMVGQPIAIPKDATQTGTKSEHPPAKMGNVKAVSPSTLTPCPNPKKAK